MTELTHLSLFSGIGGLDLAAEWAGFQSVGQCEWADYPTKVLKKHWPDVPRWRDIRTLTGDDFYARTGRRSVTVISGGFPCQPFSVAGKRRGKEDDRYLWPEMLRVIEEIRPAWVVGENVFGIVSMAEPISNPTVESRTIVRNSAEDNYSAVLVLQERMLLHGILKDLENTGYEVQTFIVPACAVDAPHQRPRICIIGHRTDALENSSRGGCGEQENVREQPRETEFERNGETVPHAYGNGSNARRAKSKRQQRKARPANGGNDVSNSNTVRRDMRGLTWERVQRPDAPCNETDSGCEDVANTKSAGFQGHDNTSTIPSERRRKGQPFATNRERNVKQWWPAEPDVGRVANGIPSRVDRLKCLGNAVVPAQFYPFFKYIAEIERNADEK